MLRQDACDCGRMPGSVCFALVSEFCRRGAAALSLPEIDLSCLPMVHRAAGLSRRSPGARA